MNNLLTFKKDIDKFVFIVYNNIVIKRNEVNNMTNQETFTQILKTHPNISFLHSYEEDEENWGKIEFFYQDDIMEGEIAILFDNDDPIEIKIR